MKYRPLTMLLLTASLCPPSIAAEAADGLPPVSAFASLPTVASPRLSPDGTRLVVLRTLGDAQHAFVVDLETGKSNPVLASDPATFFINYCDWANDARLICSIRSYGEIRSGRTGYFYRDGRTTFTRLIAVDADGGNRLPLIPEPVNRERGENKWNAIDQDNIISWLPEEPDQILIQLNRDDRIRPSVYRLNINTNDLRRVRQSHDSIYQWYADRQGNLQLAIGYDGIRPVAFNVNNNRAQALDISHFEGISEPRIISVSRDGSRAYVASYYGGNYYRIHEVEVATAKVVGTLFEDQAYDIFGGRLLLHPDTYEPILVEYYREARVRHWFDDKLAARFAPGIEALSQLHSTIEIAGLSRSLTRAILLASGNGTPPTYYFHDTTTGDLKRLAVTYADIPTIVDFEIVRYQTADGHPITAYLARPDGDGPFPTIVFPHGGPNSRDYPGFDYWSQFFVSRGYAVIKPNFRGSVGYGAEHLAAGFQQWGLTMQDDVMAGLDWMIAAGIADPKRVCVVGGSYGGYVALVAAYKTPERLRCVVSFAGVTDLVELKLRIALFDLGELTLARIQEGNSVQENSPLHQVERIGVPLLIVHGDADRSVMIEQSRSLVDALQKAGKPHRYIEQEDGDHFLSNQAHRLELFQAMDEFLATHLR